MEDKCKDEEQLDISSSDSFIDESDEEPPTSEEDDEMHLEAPLTEEEIEDLIAELLEVESKAAEAQEALEDESLAKVEVEVREELAQSLMAGDLEKAVADEMFALKEEWEAVLDSLETESAHLLEQLDGAGVELPSLYKWIESQAPNGCCTEAWKNRTHWVGSQLTSDATTSVADAEKYLQIHRPVRRKHGKILEEGASGFLGKRLATDDSKEVHTENPDIDWCSFNNIFSSSADSTSFGSKNWASVYLVSTPQQAAELGLKLPGIDEVEEIADIESSFNDPFVADAIAVEGEFNLSEEQKRNFRKVKEEDDVNLDRKLQLHLKRRRQRNRCKKEGVIKEDSPENRLMESKLDGSTSSGFLSLENDNKDIAYQTFNTDLEEHSKSSCDLDMQNPKGDGTCSEFPGVAPDDLTKPRGSKRSYDSDELCSDSKKSRVVTVNSDEDEVAVEDRCTFSSCSVSQSGQCDLQGHGDDSLGGKGSSDSLNEDFRCTACDKAATEVHGHPLLEVIICGDCKCLLEAKMQVKDPGCSDCYCAWCGRNSELLSCRSCKTLFCSFCIKRNLGEECLLGVQASGWKCCCCTPSLLQHLASQLGKARASRSLSVSSSESDSDDSDEDVNRLISTKRRHKKKIRRILEDAELGEETKRKIAIEKERQDRLKSLEARFSTKSMMKNSASFTGILSEGSSVDVLGDALTGYIVNVVREEGEEAVRIPPSLSTKLKAHQITGIRFMWDNIIQSIKKAKSGDKGLGCILAHTMGLGKTFQVIAFLYTAIRSVNLGLKTAMVVTPVNVLHNWRHEFTKWTPSELKPLRVYMLEDVPRDRRAALLTKWRTKGGVFLIGYTAFRNLSLGKHIKDRHMAKEICKALQDGPDILICDEAHMIKNTKADTTQALKQVKCQRRIALTGSPLQNNLMEYYCMVDFVREGFLGSSQEFRNRFQNPIVNGQHTNSTSDDVKIMNQRSHILYEQLKGFIQRMDMNVVKKDLPPKTVFVIAVKLSPLQRKLYKRFLDLHGFTNDKVSNEKFRKNFFAGYQVLAQIWNHPGILQLMKDRDFGKREDPVENFLADDSSSDDNLDYNIVNGEKLRNKNELSSKKNDNGFFHENWWNDLLRGNNYEVENSGKMVLLLDILSMCSDVGDKALVFSQSLCTLDLIELFLSKLPRPRKKQKFWKKGQDWYRLDGRTEGSERQKLVERFNEPSNKRVKCTLISTRAGSLGINLHAANRVIIVDGSWNPTYDLQAIYRVWRYGQTKPVFAYRLMAHGTMEEKIYKRQVTKESLSARVVDRQQVHRTISKEEMLHLFDFGDDENPNTSSENQLDRNPTEVRVTGELGNYPKQKQPLSHGTFSSDKLMETLLGRQYPRWIANYHEHESLLQENEDEKLSKEEQDMAWEVYWRTLEWEEVQRGPLDESGTGQKQALDESFFVQKPAVPKVPVPKSNAESVSKPLSLTKRNSRNRVVERKCTSVSHILTLRSQGTKLGCSTICGECAQEIRWEGLKK